MITLPQDSTLTGLRHLFDVQTVREQLNAAGADVEEGRVFYVRYKPNTNCVAAYEFTRKDPLTGEKESAYFYGKCSTSDDFTLALRKAQNHRWLDTRAGSPVIPFEAGNTLFYAFPNDARLNGLRLLETPKKLTQFFQRYLPAYPAGEWRLSNAALKSEVVRYKPERRAVFLSRTKAIDRQDDDREKLRLYWRIYCDDQAGEVFRRMRFLSNNLAKSGHLTTPLPLGFDSKAQFLMMEAIKGRPLVELLQEGGALSAVERTGEALVRLHVLADEDLPSRSPEDYIRKASETDRMLAILSPELADQSRRIFQRLRQTVPESKGRLGIAHGDFYYGQVLVERQKIGFVDFDRSHAGSPLIDLGNFIAHLKLLRLENRLQEDPDRLAQGFLNAYVESGGETPEDMELSWWTALSLFLLAVGPFRRLEPDWPQMVRAILNAAEVEMC